MSDEVLAKIAQDVGYVRGAVDGIKESIAAHITQDNIVQNDIARRLGLLETAHTSTAAKIATVKWFVGTGGAIAGFATRHFWPLIHR